MCNICRACIQKVSFFQLNSYSSNNYSVSGIRISDVSVIIHGAWNLCAIYIKSSVGLGPEFCRVPGTQGKLPISSDQVPCPGTIHLPAG
ncbi:hypothetical protein FKM82_006179 [Ascaphus truei]